MNLKLFFLLLLSLAQARRARYHSAKKSILTNRFCRPEMCEKCSMLTVYGGLNGPSTNFICKTILSRPSCCPIRTSLFLS